MPCAPARSELVRYRGARSECGGPEQSRCAALDLHTAADIRAENKHRAGFHVFARLRVDSGATRALDVACGTCRADRMCVCHPDMLLDSAPVLYTECRSIQRALGRDRMGGVGLLGDLRFLSQPMYRRQRRRPNTTQHRNDGPLARQLHSRSAERSCNEKPTAPHACAAQAPAASVQAG